MINKIKLVVIEDEVKEYLKNFNDVQVCKTAKDLNNAIKDCKLPYIMFLPKGYKIDNYKPLLNFPFCLMAIFGEDRKDSLLGKVFNTQFLKMNHIEFDEELKYYEENFIRKVYSKIHRNKAIRYIKEDISSTKIEKSIIKDENEYAVESIKDILGYIIYVNEYCPALDWDMEFKYCIYNIYKKYDKVYGNKTFEYLILELFKKWREQSPLFGNIEGIEIEDTYLNISFPDFVKRFTILTLQGEN